MLKPFVKHAFFTSRHHFPMSGSTTKTIGERIRIARAERNLAQGPLAKACRMTVSALSQIESGATKNPKPANLFAIADALGLEARYLVFGHHDKVVRQLSPSIAEARRAMPVGTREQEENFTPRSRMSR
jgi:transcriptional regulator with XRE-family HTH domain